MQLLCTNCLHVECPAKGAWQALNLIPDAYRSLKRQVRWSGNPYFLRIFQFAVIHTVKDFQVVNEAEIDVFLESPCFLYDPVNVGNLISSSSAFSLFF